MGRYRASMGDIIRAFNASELIQIEMDILAVKLDECLDSYLQHINDSEKANELLLELKAIQQRLTSLEYFPYRERLGVS
jgi:hypothetical protein